MNGLSLRVHEGSGRKRICRALRAAELIEHQLGIVFQLNAEPVPTQLIRAERMSKEFMIHPGAAVDLDTLTVSADRALGFQAREGNVVRGVSCTGRFLAHAILSMNDRR